MKHSYNDWWDGSICLNTCVIVTKKDQEKPMIIGWDAIIDSDKSKILKKQVELFQEQIDENAEKLKIDFDKRYKNSRLKKAFLEREIKLMVQILDGQLLDYGDIYVTNHRSISFEKQDLHEIQDYVKRFFVNGEDLIVDFIHSPNCMFQYSDRLPNKVRAEIYWNHYQFLKNVKKALNDVNAERKEVVSKEPENPYPLIFQSGHAYNLFLKLQKDTVGGNPKNISADYGFIFHKMKYYAKLEESVLSLNINVSESIFIYFLRNKLKIIYSADRLPKRSPSQKIIIYNNLHNEALKLL